MAYVDTLGVIEGRVTSVKIGTTSANAKDVASLMTGIGWDDNDVQEPSFVMNQGWPKRFHQGHKYVKGELRVRTEIGDVMYVRDSGGVNTISGRRFINPGVKNDICKYFVVKAVTENLSGTATNYGYVFADPAMMISGTASKVLWGTAKREVLDGQPAEWVYPFQCFFVLRSGA